MFNIKMECAVALSLSVTAWAQATAPVAHYTFDEGAGEVVIDTSGNGNNGTIHGAEFVKVADGYAMRFDGVDDYIDCGKGKAFDVTKAFSIEFWILESGKVPTEEPRIMGKSSSSYLITRSKNNIYLYKGGGPHNVRGTVIRGIWHHIVFTFQGHRLAIYIDGKFEQANELRYPNVVAQPDVPFWIGNVSDGQGWAFAGLLDEVRFYDRALGAEEVVEHYRTTGHGLGLTVRAMSVPTGKRLFVQADLRNAGVIPAGGAVNVEVLDKGKRVASQRIDGIDGKEFVETLFETAEWKPAEYVIRASIVDAGGKPVGSLATGNARLQKPTFDTTKGGYRRLNNLVVEMMNLSGAEAAKTHTFTLDREGWVFVSTSAKTPEGTKVSVILGSEVCIVHEVGKPSAQETMRYLSKGSHEIAIKMEGDCRVGKLIVRGIPELAIAGFGHRSPDVTAEAIAKFLKKHVYANTNLYLLHRPMRADKPFARKIMEEWIRDGKKFCSRVVTTHHAKLDPVTGDTVYEYFAKEAGFQHVNLSGLYVDEIHGGAGSHTNAWLEAIDRVKANPKFEGRKLYPYGTGLYLFKESRQLMRKLMECGYVFSWETYMHEQPTEAEAWFFLNQRMTENAKTYNEQIPGCMNSITVNVGIFSDIGDNCDWYTDVNQKTYFDMMLNILANDPQFRGLYGIQLYVVIAGWYPEYFIFTDEETVRWMSKLLRHYAIEGNTEMFSDDPYMTTHLKNGDFDHDIEGWALSAAEPDSIKPSRFKGWGDLQGRWPYGSEVGDTVLVMKRSKDKPNTISQEIRDLTPGRLYLLQMISVDKENLLDETPNGLFINIKNVEIIPEKSTHRVRPNGHTSKEYPADSIMINTYRTIFRATGETAKLTISDWKRKDEQGGPIGQTLLLNFIQIQPYLEE